MFNVNKPFITKTRESLPSIIRQCNSTSEDGQIVLHTAATTLFNLSAYIS